MIGRVNQQCFDIVTTITVKTVSTMLILFGLLAVSPNANALTSKKGVVSSSQDPSTVSKGDGRRSLGTVAKQSGKSERTDNDNDFVDGDGDGIRDGEEHRFRCRSKHRKQNGRHTGKQRRWKARKGNGNRP